jgi:hypothetical protein
MLHPSSLHLPNIFAVGDLVAALTGDLEGILVIITEDWTGDLALELLRAPWSD